MIRFSTSGCAIVDILKWTSEEQLMEMVGMFEKKPEFVIRGQQGIIEASEEAFYYNGGKARTFEIKDLKWKHLRKIADHAHITIQQGSWYFSIARWVDGVGHGFWYSGDMLSVGWWHGEDPQAIDHNEAMYKRRDYGS